MRIKKHGTIYHGSLGSIGATALQLTSVTRKLAQGVTIKADAGNAANFVFVGLVGVTAGISAPTTDGYKLAAGQEIEIAIDDPAKIYVIGSTTSLAVSWVGV